MDELLSGDAPVKDLPKSGGLQGIELVSKPFGTMRVYYDEESGKTLIRRIEYDNLERRRQRAKEFPEWFDLPKSPLDVEDIRYITVGKLVPGNLFSTEVRAALKVEDNRKKRVPGSQVSFPKGP